MRILFAPLIRIPKSDASYHLTRNLIHLFRQEKHLTAVSADKENGFHDTALYPCASPKKPLRRTLSRSQDRTYEEWLYATGASSKNYLLDDIAYLSDAIEHFHPDLIISMDRTAALITARKYKVPCWAIVHSDIYKNTYIPPHTLKQINTVLSMNGMEQVFDLKSLLAGCERRIGFGPIEVQPYAPKDLITRIGISSIYPIHTALTNRVCVFLPDVHLSGSSLKKMLSEAFQGAPYSLYAWFEGCKAEHIENIHFMANMKTDLIPGCIAVIHDGNDYIMNQCLARGIPQLIITDHSYLRNANAKAAERNHFGLSIYEEDLNMAKLYEQYRILVTDDQYYYHANAMKDIIIQDGDLSEILKYLNIK